MGAGPRIRCKHCGDIIQSQHRHDWVRCKCGKIFVDGGSEYLRMGFPNGKAEDYIEIMEEK